MGVRRIFSLGGLALAALAALPPSALAGTASVATPPAVSFTTVTYEAAPGEDNAVTVSQSASTYTVTDTGAPVTAGAGCVQAATNSATCEVQQTAPDVAVVLGDLDDEVAVEDSVTRARQVALFGGPGADSLRGGSFTKDFILSGVPGDAPVAELLDGRGRDDRLNPGPGDDTVLGGGGDDQLMPSAGNDIADGGPGTDRFISSLSLDGADQFIGGPGLDSVEYIVRQAPVTVTQDGVANDGATGESDNVGVDVEGIAGGFGNDILVGGATANALDGLGGDDRIEGGAGADLRLDGGSENDQIDGGPGGERSISGGPGNDRLAGGPGDDALVSFAGDVQGDADIVRGGGGIDTASFSTALEDVRVTLDGTADDGIPGEGDNIAADVENLFGGFGDDLLVGSRASNELFGSSGRDVLRGGAGADGLNGGRGADRLDAGAGRDSLAGGEGPDRLQSGDRSSDYVSCGGGADIARGDRRDELRPDCEPRRRRGRGRVR